MEEDRRAGAHPRAGELDLVRVYLDELGWHPVCTREQEVRLAQAIEAGKEARAALEARPPVGRRRRQALEELVEAGSRARQEFVRANLRLVVSVAKRYQHRGVELSDLLQEGNLGLLHAVERFDWRRGYKFSTYATWWIKKGVVQAVGDASSPLRLPRHRRDQARALFEEKARLERTEGRPPGVARLAAATGIGLAEVVAIERASAPSVSLSAPLDDDGDELCALVADPTADVGEAAIASLVPEELDRLLEGLSPAAARVLRLRYGIGENEGRPDSATHVAAVLSISPERVRQIELRALATLRRRMEHASWAS